MKLTELATTCEEGPCPTVWAVEDTGDVIVQGFKVSDVEALEAMQLPGTETAVRIPMALLLRVAREYHA